MIDVLKKAIQECGVPVAELARQTGVSHPQLSRFIRGERSLTLPAAESLVTYLGLRLVPVPKGKAQPAADVPDPTAEELAKSVAMRQAEEAIGRLKKIPKKDRLRARGFEMVSDWIEAYSEPA